MCTDVIIRAFRSLGIDLQRLVHKDMEKRFYEYPKKWGLKKPDYHIDHRRVPNLITFFRPYAEELSDEEKTKPGDIIIWDLGGGVLHIGILSDRCKGKNFLVIHNISHGVQEENIFSDYLVVKKFRFDNQSIQKLMNINLIA